MIARGKIGCVVVFVLLLLCSCKEEAKKEFRNDGSVKIDFASLEKRKTFIIPNEKMSFVKLETLDSCLIGEIEEIQIKDNLLFVLDHNQKLFVFTLSGKFLNTIGSIGHGPYEMLSLKSFYVDKERKVVGTYDMVRSQILEYDYKGVFKGKIKTSSCITQRIRNLLLLPKRTLLAVMSVERGENASMYNFKTYSLAKNECSILDSYFPYPFLKSNAEEELRWREATMNSNEVFLNPIFSNTIYLLDSNCNQKYKYIFKGDAKSVDNASELIEPIYKGYGDVLESLNKEGYDTGIRGLYATDTHLLFYYPSPTSHFYYRILWDLKKNKGYSSTAPALPYPVVNRKHSMYSTYKNKFVTAFLAMNVIGLQKSKYAIKGHKQLDAIVKDLTPEDNPIIVLYEME